VSVEANELRKERIRSRLAAAKQERTAVVVQPSMPYYRMDFIEGRDLDAAVRMERREDQALAWARIEDTPEEGLILVYRTSKDMSIPAATRKICRKPHFFPGGFAVEIEENSCTAMIRFTEYKGKRKSWSTATTPQAAFKRVDEAPQNTPRETRPICFGAGRHGTALNKPAKFTGLRGSGHPQRPGKRGEDR
jgi:hypothetical protein